MSNQLLITDSEYALEAKDYSDYLNWVFGASTFFLSISCLQFPVPWRAAVVCLGVVVPMYIYALISFPRSLRALRTLYKETKNSEVKSSIKHLEAKFHGWRFFVSNSIAFIAILLFLSVLASERWPFIVMWVKA